MMLLTTAKTRLLMLSAAMVPFFAIGNLTSTFGQLSEQGKVVCSVNVWVENSSSLLLQLTKIAVKAKRDSIFFMILYLGWHKVSTFL